VKEKEEGARSRNGSSVDTRWKSHVGERREGDEDIKGIKEGKKDIFTIFDS
jgi:hypothetical protein